MLEDLQNYVAGRTHVTARDMNTLGRVTRIVRGIAAEGGAIVDSSGAYFRKAPQQFETIWGRLTSSAGSGAFNFVQVAPGTNGTFTDVTGGYSTVAGSSGAAISSQGTNTTLSPTGTNVVMLRKGFDPGTGQRVWAFEEPAPTTTSSGGNDVTIKIVGLHAGAHQYQMQIVTQNTGMDVDDDVTSTYLTGASATNYTAINLAEIGSAVDHHLDPARSDVYFVGRRAGTLFSGSNVVHFWGAQIGEPC